MPKTPQSYIKRQTQTAKSEKGTPRGDKAKKNALRAINYNLSQNEKTKKGMRKK